MMIMEAWSRTVLKVVIMVASMCSGVVYAQTSSPEGDEGQQRQDIHQDRQDLRADRQDFRGDHPQRTGRRR